MTPNNRLLESVSKGYGVMVTQSIACVRLMSGEPDKDGNKAWIIEVGDIRTGKSVEIRVTPKGNKVEVIQ